MNDGATLMKFENAVARYLDSVKNTDPGPLRNRLIRFGDELSRMLVDSRAMGSQIDDVTLARLAEAAGLGTALARNEDDDSFDELRPHIDRLSMELTALRASVSARMTV